jgi:hypothetical protein
MLIMLGVASLLHRIFASSAFSAPSGYGKTSGQQELMTSTACRQSAGEKSQEFAATISQLKVTNNHIFRPSRKSYYRLRSHKISDFVLNKSRL